MLFCPLSTQNAYAEHLFTLVCGPGGAVLALRRSEHAGVRKLQRAQRAEITMRFKSVEGAFQVLSGQKSIADAYAEHLFTLEGDIYQTMSFVRVVEYAEAYLFPRIWSRRILREVPEKQTGSLRVYAEALLEHARRDTGTRYRNAGAGVMLPEYTR